MEGLTEEERRKLKSKKSNAIQRTLLKKRLLFQMEHPMDDVLTRCCYPVIQKIRPRLSGTFLDVGCYTGYCYHYLNGVVEYTGIDNWASAIDVAQEVFGPERFHLCNVIDYSVKHDIVFASQLGPEKKLDQETFDHYLHLANKMVIVTDPSVDNSITKSASEMLIDTPYNTYIWTK